MRTKDYFVMFVALLTATGCGRDQSNNSQQDIYKNIAIDTVFSSRADSLEWVFNNADLPITTRLIACDNLAYELLYIDIEKSNILAQKGLTLSEEIKNDSLVSLFYRTLGMTNHLQEKYDVAKSFYEKALVIVLKKKDKNFESFLYLALGLMYSDMSNYKLSAEYYEMALHLSEEIGFVQRYNTIINNIGITYLKMKNYELAEKYLLEARDVFLKNPYPNGLAHVYLNLGILYFEQERLSEAYQVSDECLRIFQSTADKTGEALALLNMSQLFAKNKEFDKSLETTHKSLKLAKEVGYPYIIKNALTQLSDIYFMIGNYGQSEYYELKHIELIDSTATTELMLAQRKIIPIYIQQSKRNQAIASLELYDALMREVNKTEVQNIYLEMQTKYETQKKELEIERQKIVIGRQNMQRRLLVGGITISLVVLILLWYMLRLRTRRNIALAQMNATKDKFFSIISHDLRNPAIAQREAIQLLVKNGSSWNIDTLTEYYAGLLHSADGQVELLFNLLNWAQIQTGRMSFIPTSFNLLTKLQPDLSLILNMSQKKGIDFTISLPNDILITGDSNMLSTVVRNLLTNAVKFTPSGGHISISVDPTGKGKYTIAVTDSGIGMNLQQMESLHRREGTDNEQGSGLGLNVCKELLEKHGSALHIESQEGKGSRFWFEIGYKPL
ncbi:MAG: tetratricopeptide repeat-containing sensor histidine kinase [Prevotellaceae bacterium]|jgi:signal transduction histidine kinase|nr:tetratricopeptide repeat-containing sensor histidine kinase [Prevotellaceae bacterium]